MTASPTSPTRVLLVEDEESFVDALVVGLEREGFEVGVARDGVEALEMFDRADADLVLLDVMLPKLSGIDVCRAIRSRSDVPIIMVSAKSTELDAVVGLEVGADDYVAKPFGLRELISRMRAVSRRRRPREELAPAAPGPPLESPLGFPERPEVIEVSGVRLDVGRHDCTVRGEEVRLTLKEFELLEILLERAGRVVSRDSLLDRVWGLDYVGGSKTLDVHVKRLRAKIEADPAHPVLITTVRGVGYRFEVPRS